MQFTDQMQRTVQVTNWPPCRIISLVPSQTELLADLGLDNQVVGITKFCIHPSEWFQHKTRIGGTKTLNFEKIAALNPDLIIGNKEENEQEQIEKLAVTYPVWMSDITHLQDAVAMIRDIGQLCDRPEPAQKLVSVIEKEFQAIAGLSAAALITAVYLIWRKPYLAVGGGTFINNMLTHAGFLNVLDKQSRYPEITNAALAELNPAVILLASEPYPFAEKHIRELQSILPESKVVLVDGELFSWYGSRLKFAPHYFRKLQAQLK